MTDTAVAATSPRFLTDKTRVKTVSLDWPAEIGGVEYRTVTVKRLTTGEVDDIVQAIRAAPDDAKPRWPVYDAAGAVLPDDVWKALDPDDTDKIGTALNDFLPARYRMVTTNSGSTQATSTTGDSTSAASPEGDIQPSI